MRGNRPKSNALRQTRICLAVAAAVMAGTPGYALSQTPPNGWEDEKDVRVSDLNGKSEAAIKEEAEKESYKGSQDILLDYSDQVKIVLISSESVADKLSILSEVRGKIDEKAQGIESGAPQWDQDLKSNLEDLSEKVEKLITETASGDKFDEESRNALLGALADNDGKWYKANDELDAARRAKALLEYKLGRWKGVNGDADLALLKSSYQLDAAAKGAIKNGKGVLTWNDKNHIDFAKEDPPGDGQKFIGKDATLEITKRSGDKSDAITGADGNARDVGTIRVIEEAKHTILVDGGKLNIQKGIEGDASLSIAVGTNGELNFVSGVGVDPNASDVTLSAAVTPGKDLADGDSGGRIRFRTGTSAGNAKIVVAEHGQLDFERRSDAGHSTIVIGAGGLAGFDDAEAGNAVISNGGDLGFLNAKVQDAAIENYKDAIVGFKDTSLDRLYLKNAGHAFLVGSTTADSARIEQDGGLIVLEEPTRVAGNGLENSEPLTIGSLSGSGTVLTGARALKLGALNQNDLFSGSIRDAMESEANSPGATVTKVGTGNLTFSGDQSGISTLNVENGTLSAAHRNALGTNLLSLAEPATISLANDVYDVKKFDNAGTLKLNGYKLVIDSYAQTGDKAKIESDARKDADGIHRGTLEVNKDGDFTKTKIVLRPTDASVTPEELLEKKIQVIVPGPGADVKLGEVDYGSIPTVPVEPGDGGDSGGGGDDGSVVIDPNKEIAFLDPNAPHSGNEQGVLGSLQGVTLNDLMSGRVGGSVLGQMVLLPAGSAEQRRAARMLSGESLVNNAAAAYGASDAFRSSMQTRMLAGGSMPDCATTNGQTPGQFGTAVWGAFKGAGERQKGDGMGFSTKGVDGAFGIDRRLNQNALVGVSFGLGSRTTRADDLPGDATVRSTSVGVYGSYLSSARWFANGGVFFSNHNMKTDRTVAARDVSARVTGKTSGRTIGFFGELGQRVIAGGVDIDPFLGVRMASTRLNGFDEADRDAGQGNNGLHVGSQTSNSRRVIAGVRLWRELVNTAGGSIIPSLRLAYEHEFGDTQSRLTNSIYGAPRAFTVSGVKLGRDIFTADLGADIRLSKQVKMHVGGNLSLRSGEKSFAGGLSARYFF